MHTCFGWWGDIFSVSGFRLDTLSSAKDKKFIVQFDAKLRDGLHCINQSLSNDRLAKMLDDGFVSHIRKICGCEQAFTSYRACRSSSVPQQLAWCLVSFEIMTGYTIVVVIGTPAVHPADTIPKATTLSTKNCTVKQWADLIEELVICGLEELVKTDKADSEPLKATFRNTCIYTIVFL